MPTVVVANAEKSNKSKKMLKYFAEMKNCNTFALTVPELHTIRTALGSFFF